MLERIQRDLAARDPQASRAGDAGLSGRPAGAVINAALLEQAVVNLVDNALKYSPPEAPVGIVAAVGRRRRGDHASADHGPGIAPEHLPRLFERFYRVDKARSRKLGGTGLGLAIVKHIAQAHRGRVTVASEVGQGSTFTITLPREVPA